MIPLFKVRMSDDATVKVNEVLASGHITQGPKVDEFEMRVSSHLQIPDRRLLTINSGTSALQLALRLIKEPNESERWPGLTDEDEVLSSPLTCTATNWPILANNLKIKWVDVNPSTCNIDICDLESKLSYKTKVIMFVHWGGCPADLDGIDHVCDKCEERFGFRPKVVEDCAHAFGAMYKGEMIGNCGIKRGHLSMFSLQAIKHLTTVDGGLLVVPNDRYYERGKLLRWYGIDRDERNHKGKDFRMENDVEEWGYKFHMNDVCAAVGLANLTDMQFVLEMNRLNANHYNTKLKDVKHVTLLDFGYDRSDDPSDWIYTL